MRSIIFLIILLSGCVTFAPKRNDTDSFKEQKSLLVKNSKYGTKYIEIDANEIKSQHFNRVYLFATWCSHCISDLKSVKRGNSKGTIYVSANYNIESIERLFAENFDTIFILKNDTYGSFEKEKIRKFAYDMTGQLDTLYATPKRFVLQKDNLYSSVNHF